MVYLSTKDIISISGNLGRGESHKLRTNIDIEEHKFYTEE